MRDDTTSPRNFPPPAPLAEGELVGELVVRKVLSVGTFGIVYRMTEPAIQVDVAVKEYLPGHLAMRQGSRAVVPRGPQQAEAFAEGLRHFTDECRLLAGLSHPSLVQVHGVWEENGTAYLVMAMCTGRNLADTRLTQWRGPGEASLRTLLDGLLGALDLLHDRGVLHRDVAPRNIMITPSGAPVLLDLGAPRRVAAARGETGPTGPREGFAPLELYGSAHGRVAGPWTDLYALAATVHFLISGRPPAAAQQRHAGDRPALALYRKGDRYTLPFLSVIDWMLAPEPADRPQSVTEVRAALAGERVAPPAHQPRRAQRLRVALHRHRRWLWVALALLAVGAAAVYAWMLWRSGLLRWPLRPVD
jgi:serine/threonine protein kinase